MEDKGTTITPIFQFAKNNGLDDYVSKNKKGREDIPVGYKR